MITQRQQTPPVDYFDEMQLEKFEELAEIVPEVAVIFADKYCAKYHVTRPDWLARKAVELLHQYVIPGSPRPVGRAKGSKQRYIQDMIHFCRWDEVSELRKAQKRAKEERDKLEKYKGKRNIAHRLEHQEKRLRQLGHTWLHVYECASITLEGTLAKGSPETMKASYTRVQNAMKDPFQAKRFCIEEYDIMKELGDDAFMDLFGVRNPSDCLT